MSRARQIQTEALIVLHGGLQNEPFFYAAKQNMRRNLKSPKAPALIEFLPDSVIVIDSDHDMTEHRF